MKIADNVYQVPGVAANCYVIVDSDGLTVIDTGLPRSHRRILAFITSLGRQPSDVRRILITHADWDHIGGLRLIHKATGARTFASKVEAEAMARGGPSRPTKMPRNASLMRKLARFFFKPGPFQVDQILSEGESLPVLGGLRVIDSAGHSPGHISFFSPSAGILFCGDSMVTDQDGIHGSRPIFTWDEAMARSAVKKQAALGGRILCSGHGPVVLDAVGKYPA